MIATSFLKLFRPRVGIIGYGAMGTALAAGMNHSFRVSVFDKDASRCDAVVPSLPLHELVDRSAVLIIAVKPQDVESLMQQLRPIAGGRLVISIAAGISTALLQTYLGEQARLIRVMPNLPAKIGQGVTAVCRGGSAGFGDERMAVRLFSCVGRAMSVPERLMDAVTAVSGSGPGFFFWYLERTPAAEWETFARGEFQPQLAAAAQACGFSPAQAQLLAAATTAGSLAMARQSTASPAALRQQVTSKGGTTEAGLNVLNSGGSLCQAVQAAQKRSAELARN